MQTQYNNITYGVYIDGKKAFVFSSGENVLPKAIILDELLNLDLQSPNIEYTNQEQIQNSRNEKLKKFTRRIADLLIRAEKILIFGSAECKYEMRNAINTIKHLKLVKKEIFTTDIMEKKEALIFFSNRIGL